MINTIYRKCFEKVMSQSVHMRKKDSLTSFSQTVHSLVYTLFLIKTSRFHALPTRGNKYHLTIKATYTLMIPLLVHSILIFHRRVNQKV